MSTIILEEPDFSSEILCTLPLISANWFILLVAQEHSPKSSRSPLWNTVMSQMPPPSTRPLQILVQMFGIQHTSSADIPQ